MIQVIHKNAEILHYESQWPLLLRLISFLCYVSTDCHLIILYSIFINFAREIAHFLIKVGIPHTHQAKLVTKLLSNKNA